MMDKVIYLDEIGRDIYEDKVCGEDVSGAVRYALRKLNRYWENVD